jgi:hypothetical protein
VVSWFIDRYGYADRQRIYAAWKAAGLTHVLTSWPDSQDFGQTPQQFKSTQQELIANGFYPCPMMCAKPTSSDNVRTEQETLANIMLVLPLLVGIIPLCCVGWELSLFLSPADVQMLIDAMAPLLTPSGCRLHVHFQEGYGSYQQDGGTFADFWNRNIGKLTGILRQKKLAQDRNQYWYDSGGICDVLTRFAGNFLVSPDSGFGHPFDDVELEITATFQYNGDMSEADGNDWGTWAINAPPQFGPAGYVGVQGSGNGFVQ